MSAPRVSTLAALAILAPLTSAGPTLAGVPTAVVHAPRIALRPTTGGHGGSGGSTSPFGWASSNWSGYAVTGSTYTAITGSWTVPAVSPSRGLTAVQVYIVFQALTW